MPVTATPTIRGSASTAAAASTSIRQASASGARTAGAQPAPALRRRDQLELAAASEEPRCVLMWSARVALFPDREGIAERVGPTVGIAIVIAATVQLIAVTIVEAPEVAPSRGEAARSPIVGGEAQLPLKAIDRKFYLADLTLR